MGDFRGQKLGRQKSVRPRQLVPGSDLVHQECQLRLVVPGRSVSPWVGIANWRSTAVDPLPNSGLGEWCLLPTPQFFNEQVESSVKLCIFFPGKLMESAKTMFMVLSLVDLRVRELPLLRTTKIVELDSGLL